MLNEARQNHSCSRLNEASMRRRLISARKSDAVCMRARQPQVSVLLDSAWEFQKSSDAFSLHKRCPGIHNFQNPPDPDHIVSVLRRLPRCSQMFYVEFREFARVPTTNLRCLFALGALLSKLNKFEISISQSRSPVFNVQEAS